MSGIYIHIPFCKKACHYCNFHFSTNLSRQEEMVTAICKDIDLRHKYLTERKIDTLYFGGGTPSLLTMPQLDKILSKITQHFDLDKSAEITYECNPDDINTDFLRSIKLKGINRLSIGIQSFFDEDLVFMNRSHNADEASKSIARAQDIGFENISIDLIYGSTTTTSEMWQSNVEKALSFDIPHISSYCLTIEEKTVFDKWVKSKKMPKPDDDNAIVQFEHLINTLTQNGYDHYEISNFGKPQNHAVHNTNYWRGKPYLGIGPAAHSYNGKERSWAIANNALYISNINNGLEYIENEELSTDDKYNEYIMMGLRTMWGIDLGTIKNTFGQNYFIHVSKMLLDNWLEDKLEITGTNIKLSKLGKFFADRVASNLFA